MNRVRDLGETPRGHHYIGCIHKKASLVKIVIPKWKSEKKEW
jgi:hypothetical protein